MLAHCIDTAIWLNGPIVEVSAMTETFIKERVHAKTGKKAKVTIDDACAFLAKFANGSLAIFESTRYARGHKALYTLEINGADGSLAWDLHDLHRLEYFEHDKEDAKTRGWRRSMYLTVANTHTWTNGGFQDSTSDMSTASSTSLLTLSPDTVRAKRPLRPDFRDALETQYIPKPFLIQQNLDAGKSRKDPFKS